MKTRIKEIIAGICIVPLMVVKIADLALENKLTNALVCKTDDWIYKL